jgi:type IV pilus assembly protein PilE
MTHPPYPKALRPTGFTLIELLIAIVIVSILAAVALPSYRDYVATGKLAEATATLSELRTRAEQYYADNRTFTGFPCQPTETPKYFDIVCNVAANAYTITADGKAAQDLSGFQYTINQANAKTSTTPSSSGACWITKKGGSC